MEQINSSAMSSLAMSNFVEPTLSKKSKVKCNLQSVVSVSYINDGRLLVADNEAGKVLSLSSLDGRNCHVTVLNADVSPYGVTQLCGVSDTMAVVHSTDFDESVKIMSNRSEGQVHCTWGRGLQQWTPRAVAATPQGNVVVSNIHPQASARLTIHTTSGQQVSTFGRPTGPGNLTFRQPLHIAVDAATNRLLASDTLTNSVKIFDLRGNFISEFGSSPDGDKLSTLNCPLGLCSDQRGNIIVCDSGNDRLAMFCHDGRFICNLLSFNTSRRRSWFNQNRSFPVSVALSEVGDQLIVTIDKKNGDRTTFRKLSCYSVEPCL